MYKEGKSSDYLKYYRVIRGFILIKYKLKLDRLDILLFLYSEQHFDKRRVREYESIMTWSRRRWDGLLRDGWIVGYRPSKHHLSKLYCLSQKGINLVERFYSYLEGAEIPMSPEANPAFRRNVRYTDKVYRNMIKRMNAAIYEQRRAEEEGKDWIDLTGVYD